MADKRIIEFPETTNPGPDYFLVTDSSSDGVKKILVSNVTAAAVAAAQAAADAAEAAAAALGNQVHQYDTRTQAAATAIPVGVNSIRIFRYATGYPLSVADYVPGTSTGPAAFQDANGNYWQLSLADGRGNAYWFGAKGDNTADDTAALQAAVNNCDVIDLGPGTFKTTGPLIKLAPAGPDTTLEFNSGVIIRGAGMLRTKILYSGSTNNIGILNFTTPDATGLKYILGVEVTDLHIERASGAGTGIHGIILTATWMPTFRRLQIENVTGHGIYVPFRSDFHEGSGFGTGSDVYQDLYPKIEDCRILGALGWGIRFEAGNGAGSFYIAHNQFVGCAGGGFYTEVGQGTLDDNVFTSCGTESGDPSLTGGVIVAASTVEDGGTVPAPQPTPFSMRIIHNEFDTNETQHLRIKSGVGTLIDRNRFLSNVVGGVMVPPTHVALGRSPDNMIATNTVCTNNAHRSTTPSALPVFWYDQETGSTGTYIRNPLDLGSGTGRVKTSGLTSANGTTFIDGNIMMIGPVPEQNTGTAVALTSGTTANIAALINLPIGEWDIMGSVLFNPAATTNYTVRDFSISPTSAAHTQNPGQYFIDRIPGGVVPANQIGGETVFLRVNVSVPTPYYLTARAFFTVSTMTASGIIRARRVNR